MPASSASPALPGLFVLSGLVASTAQAAPVPSPDTAESQLRAINHRFLHAGIDASGDLIEALTHADFLCTQADGTWLPRERFVAQVRRQPPLPGARSEDLRVRLFGRVALVHGVVAVRGQDDHATTLRYTDTYLWRGTAWQLVSAQDTTLQLGAATALVTGTAPTHAPRQRHDPTGDDPSVLHALNDHYVKAFREADVAWYDAHLAADYLIVQGDGSFHDRATALTRFALPRFATTMTSFPVDKVQVRRFDDVALIHAENAYELKDGRKGISRYTDIWHKQAGRWLCIAAHITPHQAPAMQPSARPSSPGRARSRASG
ncbi:MAG TPA: nuclear transport factor 2 family protein [Burkholderiaceae bacterium]